MPNQYHKCLTLTDGIVNADALIDNIGNVIKIKYFTNKFTTMTSKLP
jgi:hypothetical protein